LAKHFRIARCAEEELRIRSAYGVLADYRAAIDEGDVDPVENLGVWLDLNLVGLCSRRIPFGRYNV
jgi:hypothetical protein